jgi:MSHA biogenesis protein MshN
MSVINQMLKDLDKRQVQQPENSTPIIGARPGTSTLKITLIVVSIAVLLNVVGFYAWQLYSENKSLKTQVSAHESAQVSESKATETNKQTTSAVEQATQPGEKITSNQQPIELDKSPATSAIASMPSIAETLPSETLPSISQQVSIVSTTQEQIPTESVNAKAADKQKPIRENLAQVVNEPSLTISRRELSPQALVKKKIIAAEQALEANEIAEAETLFEDVLLVMPEHHSARKQLAALWYGKKAYQNALNLLSQGIAMAPKTAEMRLMSARIYLEQGLIQQAMNILQPVASLPHTELQSLLATIAGQLSDHKSAVKAYENLILLEPSTGRWWLGLAVSFDSQGKFAEASQAYKQALTTKNLSDSTAQFARQRVIELGD